MLWIWLPQSILPTTSNSPKLGRPSTPPPPTSTVPRNGCTYRWICDLVVNPDYIPHDIISASDILHYVEYLSHLNQENV